MEIRRAGIQQPQPFCQPGHPQQYPELWLRFLAWPEQAVLSAFAQRKNPNQSVLAAVAAQTCSDRAALGVQISVTGFRGEIWSTASTPSSPSGDETTASVGIRPLPSCSAEGAVQLEKQFCCRWSERLTRSEGRGRNICQWRPFKMMLEWRVCMFRYPLQ